ncbi:MAG: hypothetical protein WAO21_04450 [Verrucomicrobiia bacterium]
MNRYARTSPGQSLEIIPIERPYSFFHLIETRFGGCQPLRRIFSQVRMHNGQTMVIEKLGDPEDLREENTDLRTRNPDLKSSAAYRLSFFTAKFATRQRIAHVTDKDFIGYAVVKEDSAPSFGDKRRVYESVIRPSRLANNFVRGGQDWLCQVDGKPFKVNGYLYAQQNALTNVCAHVALRTAAARFHPNGDMSYREMNQLLGIDHVNVKMGEGNGLTTQQMQRVLEAAGAKCFPADYSNPSANPPPFQKYIYGSIESGYPAIVIFGTTDPDGGLHAVPVFGHTLNQDTWVPNADFSYFKIGAGTIYIPSESWLSMFLVHDDNWGSNYCIPRHYLRPKPHPAPGQPAPAPEESVSQCVAHVISTMPKEVQLNPVRAEIIGADYLFTILPQLPPNNNPWAERLALYANAHMLVLRPYLLDPAEYTAHLEKVKDWKGNAVRETLIRDLRTNLTKERLWMIELSVPELFSANLRKVGEVLVRAELLPAVDRDLGSFVLARLPGYFALLAGGTPADPQYQFIPSGTEGHVELIGCEGDR